MAPPIPSTNPAYSRLVAVFIVSLVSTVSEDDNAPSTNNTELRAEAVIFGGSGDNGGGHWGGDEDAIVLRERRRISSPPRVSGRNWTVRNQLQQRVVFRVYHTELRRRARVRAVT